MKSRPQKKPSKREAILQAMLDVVVERGFHEAPMSLIAQRSGASAGVIYHYFKSKEEIIQALYEQIYALKHASIFVGYDPQMDSKEAFLLLSQNAYTFYRKHSRELQFLTKYETSGFRCLPEKPADSKDATAFERLFRPRSQGGILNDLPPEVVHELTVGLAERLARLPRKLPPAVFRRIAEKIWEVVT